MNPREVLALKDDPRNLGCVPNIFERVARQKDEVREHTIRDRAQGVGHLEGPRGIDRRCSKRVDWGEADAVDQSP
jgi:hypothetical protein